ncbi:MAG: rhodanese-like domain-containing protein [Xanthobacteraceae bacterium]
MTAAIDASTLKAWLSDGTEIALLDVREHGQYGAGHPFFAVPLPYSRFEVGLPALVPNPAARLVLYDDGDGVAARAARLAHALGYGNLHVLTGGARAWHDAGHTLYRGVNVPSKAFGELVEQARHTPRVSPQALQAMLDRGDKLAIIDGRPLAEYRKMNIPGGICCPNGELALRIKDIVPDPAATIVVNCAGRTRSIIGAQTLIDFGIPNPVYALENGTQGWFLAGLALEHGATRRYGDRGKRQDIIALQTRAREIAQPHGVAWVEPATAQAWLSETSRTTYLLDVRTAEETAAQAAPGFVHAPGGQLIQATDQWVGVKGARLVLVDDELVRAPVVAGWLRQLGHEACVLASGLAAARALAWMRDLSPPDLPVPPPMAASDVARGLADGAVQMIDLRPSMTYRAGHIPQAIWSTRPRIAAAVADGRTKPIVLVADDASVAALAARDLGEAGFDDLRLLAGGYAAWRDAGLSIVATPHDPADADCIDFLFFVHDRHEGNADAARAYLAWETGLLDQLDAQERAAFRLTTNL